MNVFLGNESRPIFTDTIQNVTVTKGRDAVLSCKVENIANYKVSKLVSSEKIPRVGVTKLVD